MLMIRFYTFWLKEQQQPAEALQKAQIWMRDSSPEAKQKYFKQQTYLPQSVVSKLINYINYQLFTEPYFQHPYHWAAFGYYGA